MDARSFPRAGADTMPRPILAEDQLHPAIRAAVASLHADVLTKVQSAVARHAVVVVGMAGNPFVRKARRALDAAGVAHHDLDYGSYLAQWRRRNALKMWTGWPTFPMVFVKGQLVGGANDLQALIDSGELKRLMSA
jgi:glutaredoxin-related protein